MAKYNNILVPVHTKLDEEESNLILKKYNLNDRSKLPKIKVKDPALEGLSAQIGDIIQIERKSFAGKSKYYRVVIE